MLPINRKPQAVDHFLRQVGPRAYLLDSSGAEQIADGKGNGNGVGKFRRRFCAAAEYRSLVRIDALEPVEEIIGAHVSVDAKADAVGKPAIGLEKNAAIIAPNTFFTSILIFVFGLCGNAGNLKKRSQQRQHAQLITNGPAPSYSDHHSAGTPHAYP